MASLLETSDFGYQNFFETALTSDITDSALDIFLDSVPSVSEGTLVIDPESDTNREIIYFSSKTSTKVVCPANGRGYDSSTATSHTAGTTVIMAPIADWFYSLRSLFTTTPQGYTSVGYTPATVTNNGNRSYDLVFSGVDLTGILSKGMRLKMTRTVTAPTKCTDLESSSSQYFNKTSPAGTTFTDDFVAGAWVKLESYTSTDQTIISRYNGTSGWHLSINNVGQVNLAGYNGGLGNVSYVVSYQSVPLNRWVYIAAQLDMSAFTTTSTTSYIMIDGVDVPCQVSRAGTNPTALVQAGNLEVGARNSGTTPFDGKLAQVFYSSAKITQANVRTLMGQGLTASLISTHSIVSAYSFDNSINDLNTGNANNLTAQGSAVATATDSPFAGGNVQEYTDGTTEFGIISKDPVFSPDTTLTVQVPEGYALPTSGGISAVSYSTHSVPYGFPRDKGKWRIATINKQNNSTTSNATYGAFLSGGHAITVPIGAWIVGHHAGYNNATTTSVHFTLSSTALTGMSQVAGDNASPGLGVRTLASSAAAYINSANVSRYDTLTSATTYVMYTFGATTSAGFDASVEPAEIYAEFAYL